MSQDSLEIEIGQFLQDTYTPNQLVEKFNVSYHQVIYAIYRKRLKAVKIGPGWRILPPLPTKWAELELEKE